MMKLIFLKKHSLVFFILFLLNSCFYNVLNFNDKDNKNDNTKSLYAYNFVNNSTYKVFYTKLYEGTKSIIYVENTNLNKVDAVKAQSIANEFDNNIYPVITNKFGSESDIDNNGKIIILILDIVDGGSITDGYTAGYFDSSNELSSSSYNYSNENDMFYMDCNPGIPDDDTFRITLAHEFQHMINYNQKVLMQHTFESEIWLNEGLSSAAETVYSGNINQNKIYYYNNSPYNSDIENGLNFFSWGARGDTFGYYSTVYLFFQWLRIQSNNGENIFKEIINNVKGNYLAVEETANNNLYSGTWTDFLRDWFIANQFNDTSGKYGYKGEITTGKLNYTGTSPVSLYSGEGVYRTLTASYTPPSNPINLIYAGLDTTNKVVKLSAPYTGDTLLCLNVNPNLSSTNIIASLPSIVFNPFKIQMMPLINKKELILPMDAVLNKNK